MIVEIKKGDIIELKLQWVIKTKDTFLGAENLSNDQRTLQNSDLSKMSKVKVAFCKYFNFQ